jgi:hypothetical protein
MLERVRDVLSNGENQVLVYVRELETLNPIAAVINDHCSDFNVAGY